MLLSSTAPGTYAEECGDPRISETRGHPDPAVEPVIRVVSAAAQAWPLGADMTGGQSSVGA